MAKIAKAGKSAVPTDYRQKTEELAARLERLPNSRFNLLILGAGVVAFLVEAMDTSVIASVLGPLKKILALNPAQTGLISVAAIITTVVGVLLAGPLADLYGRKKNIGLGSCHCRTFYMFNVLCEPLRHLSGYASFIWIRARVYFPYRVDVYLRIYWGQRASLLFWSLQFHAQLRILYEYAG